MNLSLADFFFLLALETEMAPRLRLYVQRAFFPVEVSVLGVLHFGITNTGIQEQTEEQLLFIVHSCKHHFEFLLRVGLRWLLCIVELCKNLAGSEDASCAQKCVQSFEDVVNRAIVQIALVVSQELHVPQKSVAVNLV